MTDVRLLRSLTTATRMLAISLPLGCHPPGAATGKDSSTTHLTASGTENTTTPSDPTDGSSGDSTTGSPMIGCDAVAWAEVGKDYKQRVRLTIKQGAVTETLADFPLLVVFPPALTTPIIEYNTRNDIAFTDAMGNTLPHEFEGPPLLQDPGGDKDCATRPRNIWVKTNIEVDADTCIFMYYDHTGVSDNDLGEQVWDEWFTKVWHVNSNTIGAWDDSTRKPDSEIPCTTNGGDKQAECAISDAMPPYPTPCLNGNACRNIPNMQPVGFYGDSLLPASNGYSLSFWWSPWGSDTNAYTNRIILGALSIESPTCEVQPPLCHRDPEMMQPGTKLKSGNFIFAADGGFSAYFQMHKNGSPPDPQNLGQLALNKWYNFAVTIDNTANIVLYVNGAPKYVQMMNPADVNNVVCIGGNWWDTDELDLGEQPNSHIDEIQISNTIRSPAWINASYNNRICPSNVAPQDNCGEATSPFVEISDPQSLQ